MDTSIQKELYHSEYDKMTISIDNNSIDIDIKDLGSVHMSHDDFNAMCRTYEEYVSFKNGLLQYEKD